jgi:hypothetical protein
MGLTEEQPPITVKGFLNPLNTYKIGGAYDELVKSGGSCRNPTTHENTGMRSGEAVAC